MYKQRTQVALRHTAHRGWARRTAAPTAQQCRRTRTNRTVTSHFKSEWAKAAKRRLVVSRIEVPFFPSCCTCVTEKHEFASAEGRGRPRGRDRPSQCKSR